MKILVTGASGFLGSYLLPVLGCDGHEVIAASRSAERRSRWVVCDLTDLDQCMRLPSSVEVIVHAAAVLQRGVATPEAIEQMVRVNVLGTLNLLRYAYARAVRRVILCSSMAVYAPGEVLPIPECAATYPAANSDGFYGMTKLASELLAAKFCRDHQIEFFALRFAQLYGLGLAGDRTLSRWVRQAYQSEELTVYACGQRTSDFLYVEDALRGVICAVKSQCDEGTFNIGSGAETSWRAMAEAVVSVFSPPGCPAGIKYVEHGDRSRCYLDISQARKVLGFEPKYSLVEGLKTWRDLEDPCKSSQEEQAI